MSNTYKLGEASITCHHEMGEKEFTYPQKNKDQTIEALLFELWKVNSSALPDDCIHNWIDPTNEKVESGAHRICTRCGIIAIPTESPALPDDVQAVIDRLTDPKKSAVLRDYTAADLIERLAREAELRQQSMGQLRWAADKIVLLQAKVEELEDQKRELIMILDNIRQKTDILPFTPESTYASKEDKTDDSL